MCDFHTVTPIKSTVFLLIGEEGKLYIGNFCIIFGNEELEDLRKRSPEVLEEEIENGDPTIPTLSVCVLSSLPCA